MVIDLIKEKLISVDAFGGSYVNKKVKDTSVTLLKFQKILKLIYLYLGYILIKIKEW